MKTTLILFSKPPSDAAAKTRLRVILDDDVVQQIHRAFVFDSLLLFESVKAKAERVCYWRTESLDDLQELSPGRHELQIGESFPIRFEQALVREASGGTRNVIVIGSDCPLLSPEILEVAIHSVERGNLVIGPAPEGGFYLLGVPIGATLSGIASVFDHALESVGVQQHFQHLPLKLLPPLIDVDLPADILSLYAELSLRQELPKESQQWIPPNTRSVLQSTELSTIDSRTER